MAGCVGMPSPHPANCTGLTCCRRAVEESGSGGGPSVKDIDDAVEAFMKRQAELESGGMCTVCNLRQSQRHAARSCVRLLPRVTGCWFRSSRQHAGMRAQSGRHSSLPEALLLLLSPLQLLLPAPKTQQRSLVPTKWMRRCGQTHLPPSPTLSSCRFPLGRKPCGQHSPCSPLKFAHTQHSQPAPASACFVLYLCPVAVSPSCCCPQPCADLCLLLLLLPLQPPPPPPSPLFVLPAPRLPRRTVVRWSASCAPSRRGVT